MYSWRYIWRWLTETFWWIHETVFLQNDFVDLTSSRPTLCFTITHIFNARAQIQFSTLGHSETQSKEVIKHLHTVWGSRKLVAGNRYLNLQYCLACAVYATATATMAPVKIGIRNWTLCGYQKNTIECIGMRHDYTFLSVFSTSATSHSPRISWELLGSSINNLYTIHPLSHTHQYTDTSPQPKWEYCRSPLNISTCTWIFTWTCIYLHLSHVNLLPLFEPAVCTCKPV